MSTQSERFMPWAIVAMLCSFMVLSFADKAVLGFAAVPIMKELNLTPAEFGLAGAAVFWLHSISAICGGFVANRAPTKWVLAVLALSWGLTQFPMLWISSLSGIVACRIALGIGEAPAFSVALHACFKWFENDRRALPTSIVSEGAAIGVVLAAPALTYVIIGFGWRYAFGLLGVLTLLWVVVWVIFGAEGKVTDAPAQPQGGQEAAPLSYAALLLNRTFIGNVIAGFSVSWGITVTLTWLAPYLTKGLGYSPTTTGWLMSLPWAASVVVVIAFGWLSQRMLLRGASSRTARGVFLSLCLLAGGAATAAMTMLAPGVPQMILLIAGFALPTMVWTLSPAVIGEVTPTRRRGAVIAIFSATAYTAGAIAPFIMGLVIERGATPAEGYANGFLLTGAVQILGGLIALAMIHPQATLASFARRLAPSPIGALEPSGG